jgi:hypothetical protein
MGIPSGAPRPFGMQSGGAAERSLDEPVDFMDRVATAVTGRRWPERALYNEAHGPLGGDDPERVRRHTKWDQGDAERISDAVPRGEHAGGLVPHFAVGGFDVSKGLMGRQPFAGSRQLHVGPVVSSVPGRTDNHKIKVPSGSYVLPAAHVSSMGHGNTLSGFSLADKMFGGPYGVSAKAAHPAFHAPHMSKSMLGYSSGGAPRNPEANDYEPVDVDVSGGEYIVPPWVIQQRYGNLDNGHKVLDDWVMDQRAKEIKTQKALPPPAKD